MRTHYNRAAHLQERTQTLMIARVHTEHNIIMKRYWDNVVTDKLAANVVVRKKVNPL